MTVKTIHFNILKPNESMNGNRLTFIIPITLIPIQILSLATMS